MKLKTLVNALWNGIDGIDKIDIYLGTPAAPVFLSSLEPNAALNCYGDMRVKKFNLWHEHEHDEIILDIILA